MIGLSGPHDLDCPCPRCESTRRLEYKLATELTSIERSNAETRMMHPAALIESGDWSAVAPEVAMAAGRRHMLQAKVIHAALEYFLIDEQCYAFFNAEYDKKKGRQLEKRAEEGRADLMKACDALLKLVPSVDTHRPRPSKRKAVRA